MILKIEDWEFDIDMERTMEYSAAEAAEHCDCAYCRNFYASVDHECPELRPLLAQFGIDIEAPDALYPYDVQDWMRYEGEYVVFGKILREGNDRICVENGVYPYIYPTKSSDYALAEAHFVLSLEELELPWILDEPLKDVRSMANEPSFLKRMWDKLLGKMKKSDMES